MRQHIYLFLFLLAIQQLISKENKHPIKQPEQQKKMYNTHKQPLKKHPQAYAWENKNMSPSPPPPLMGKQMGVVETLGVPPLGYTWDKGVKVFHLIAQPIEKVIVDASWSTFEHLVAKKHKQGVPKHHHEPIYQKMKCWGYNGSTPGPTIEATEGDRIRIVLKNELPEPTSIHWHGMEVPNCQDGATPETARPVMPGETFTYEFTLYQSGTLMYHSGFNIMKQDHMGLAGIVVIHPKKYEQKVGKQFAIMLQQWALLPGNEYLNLVTNEFNWFTFNAFASPNIPIMEINQHERVRIRFGNIIMDAHPIHIHGYIWEEVGTEGGPIPVSARKKGSTINVASGTTRDVEFVAWNPGLWRFHCHKLHHTINAHAEIPMGIMSHGGMFTLVNVIPKNSQAPWQHPKQDIIEECNEL